MGVIKNLNFGFLSSESIEIFDEIAPVSSQKISEGNIFKKKQAQDREKIIDFERIKPEVQVKSVRRFPVAKPFCDRIFLGNDYTFNYTPPSSFPLNKTGKKLMISL